MVRIWYPAEGSFPENPIRLKLDLEDGIKKNQKLIWLLGLSRPLYSYAQPEAPLFESQLSFSSINLQ
jgi:hypothetical protein